MTGRTIDFFLPSLIEECPIPQARQSIDLRALRPLVERGDGAALEQLFAEARAARERWLSGEYE